MRSIIFACMLWSLLASTALAAPLTDYAAGNLAVEVSLRTVENESDEAEGTHNTYSARSGVDFGATLGLGGRWALQYRGLNVESQDNSFSQWPDGSPVDPNYESLTERMRLRAAEVNLLYRWNRYCSLFAGNVRAKGRFSSAYRDHDPLEDLSRSRAVSTRTKAAVQFGVVGLMPLAPKLTGYASLGVGKDVSSWGVGISYRLTRDMDFNLDYRKLAVKGLRSEDAEMEAETGGLGFGMTYRL
ncbi:outer membrane beta-barrel protein [Acetonema longum]|uniref:OmpA/MotB domain protein n=1 Tax=Acetonema longum DSM 6540 TaxID=1009370 RepID=F7NFH7_9FIRM|nr:outer membrane beta-barrel protein [Acetonema longum]EGO65232.1 OmpA/MotB domain protein [Acetonema longum DSM 6540]